jgi:hypothetical protein
MPAKKGKKGFEKGYVPHHAAARRGEHEEDDVGPAGDVSVAAQSTKLHDVAASEVSEIDPRGSELLAELEGACANAELISKVAALEQQNKCLASKLIASDAANKALERET